MTNISIIIPVLNEAGNIKELVTRLDRALRVRAFEYEMIFVDDHSTDNTIQILKNIQHLYPIKIYGKKGEKGKAQSLLEGFSYAKYPLLAMIDADLQYPPEAIPDMALNINDEVGVVVGNRKEFNASLRRKVISRMFKFVFGRFLHGFKVDVQSGIKVFKKEIVDRVTLHPSPWTFDLEFLIKARNAGYQIMGHQIIFDKRHSGLPKIGLLKASFEIGLSALKLRFKNPGIVPFLKKNEEKRGKGFHYKGMEFVHFSGLHHRETAFFVFEKNQKIIAFVFLVLLTIDIIINPWLTLILLIGAVTFLYFVDIFFNLFLVSRSFVKVPEYHILHDDMKDIRQWPMYTVFCPLYKEWGVLPQFIKAINRLDYPKNKLQVVLLLEEDDDESIKNIVKLKIPKYFEIVIVPHGNPKTKPKALNYGLNRAKGEYIVIYDAEDVPEARQLKKAVTAFKKADRKTICMQAKLNFYNTHHNILTRIFTSEYSLWFNMVLTGLQTMDAPIPLGGTSNHFKTDFLKSINGWDAFNVTEDCDLGIRIARKGFKTAIIDSVTLEEANSKILNWFNQRTRWIKGYMQTYFVHTRHTGEMSEWGSLRSALTFQLIVGFKVLSMLVNPLMWGTTVIYFAFRAKYGPMIEQFFPAPILYPAVFSLIVGNFIYMYNYMIGCVRHEKYDLVKYVFLVPFYWLLMSLAGWSALVKLIYQPHYWYKTKHGFHLEDEKHRFEDIITKLEDDTPRTQVHPLAQPVNVL